MLQLSFVAEQDGTGPTGICSRLCAKKMDCVRIQIRSRTIEAAGASTRRCL
jgi:hypothetical protein